MNWLTLAQSVPDAKELATGDAQSVLAWVVGALMLTVVVLFGLLLKQNSSWKAEVKANAVAHKVETDALNAKNDKLAERLLRYVANINQMLSGHAGPAPDPAPVQPADPLDLNGGPV